MSFDVDDSAGSCPGDVVDHSVKFGRLAIDDKLDRAVRQILNRARDLEFGGPEIDVVSKPDTLYQPRENDLPADIAHRLVTHWETRVDGQRQQLANTERLAAVVSLSGW